MRHDLLDVENLARIVARVAGGRHTARGPVNHRHVDQPLVPDHTSAALSKVLRHNLRERLRSLYGSDARLVIERERSCSPQRTRVALELPIRAEVAA